MFTEFPDIRKHFVYNIYPLNNYNFFVTSSAVDTKN